LYCTRIIKWNHKHYIGSEFRVVGPVTEKARRHVSLGRCVLPADDCQQNVDDVLRQSQRLECNTPQCCATMDCRYWHII